MSEAQCHPIVHAVLSDYIVADGDVERPTAGAVLHGLALRHRPRRERGPVTRQVLSGTVTWARVDSASGLVESVVDLGRFRILTQDDVGSSDSRVGQSVALDGTLESVGPHEFEAFDLPDVRLDWRVLSSRRDEVSGNYVLELQPMS